VAGNSWDRVPIDAQSIDAPLSLAAVFLVVRVASGLLDFSTPHTGTTFFAPARPTLQKLVQVQ
jgi:hypothetical protein